MKRLVVVVLILGFACFGCAFGRPAGKQPQAQDTPVNLPFRCIKYISRWEGKGARKDLEMLEKMSTGELREFLKDFEVEP